jgi:hypothetical protein
MAPNQLTAGNGSGTQATTQSPQTAGQPAATGTQSGNVQPGTATNLLNSSGGVPLRPTPLSTVSLTPSASTPAVLAQSTVTQPKHHINPVLFGFSGLLLLVAVVSVWIISRSAKNTTEY